MSALPPPVRPANCSSPARIYRRHRPERTALYRVAQQQLEAWLAHRHEREADGVPSPRYVERELRGFAHTHLRSRVTACAGQPVTESVPVVASGTDPALPGPTRRRASIHCARLLARIYELRPLRVPGSRSTSPTCLVELLLRFPVGGSRRGCFT